MTEIQILIDRIKYTNYKEIPNGKALKEIDFQELSSLCSDLEQQLLDI